MKWSRLIHQTEEPALWFQTEQRQTSHQSSSAGASADGGGHRADGADGGAAGAVGQGRDPHGHPLALLGLGRAGGGEADANHLVDGGEQAELGETLEVSAERGGQRVFKSFSHMTHVKRFGLVSLCFAI